MKLFAAILIVCSSIALAHSAVDADVSNKFVERVIDLSSQLVKISYTISVNFQRTDAKQVELYNFVLPKNQRANVAHISIKDYRKKELKYTEKETSNGVEFLIQLPDPGKTATIHIDTVSVRELIPHPAQITQSETQLVRYYGLLFFYSPYVTHSQKATVVLASSNIEYHTPFKPIQTSGNKIVYGTHETAVEPFVKDELMLHFENQTPFLTVTKLERTLEVSHWGNIAVTEYIDMLHSGAKLKGPFSRYEFQKDTRSGQAAVKSFKTILPASASGVYYRDTNGNISTSNMRILSDSVELEIRPRFPLFGGWRTFYTIGYNVPSFEYLFNSGENFLLKMRIVDHIFDDMLIDEAVIKIILPEGSTNIKLLTPYPITRLPDSTHYTYLDTYGRPVITFSKKNLVENHISDFNLKYNFSRITMLQEPLLAVAFFFALFLVVIVCLRLDFSISREKETHAHRD